MIDKYKLELKEILDELVIYNPSLYVLTGPTELFNWRSLFDFSSFAWEELPDEFRIAILKGLAEKGSLFIALMTYKTMYIEMGRPDIVNAAALSLAQMLETLFSPAYDDIFKDSFMEIGRSVVQESLS